jgi:hypothetical protein
MERSKKSGLPKFEQKRDQKMGSGLNPYGLLRESIRAVPAVKYALGVAGIVSAIAIVSAFGMDLRIAGFGTIITFALMVVLVVFAKLSTTAPRHFLVPVLLLMWSFLVLTIATAFLLFSSVFFNRPVDLHEWLKPHRALVLLERIAALPAAKVLEAAYLGSAPAMPMHYENPKLQFEILAKHKGETNFNLFRDGDSLASGVDDYLIVARP